MKRKTFIIILIIAITVVYISKKTVSTNELSTINTELIIENEDNLTNKLQSYIDLIDNSIITQSSYAYSSTLSENYDFLVNFAISLIINNKEYYQEEIVSGETYNYNKDGISYKTNEYINKEKIYEITNDVFGKKYFYIINEQFEDNGLIPLLLLENKKFDMQIEKIINIKKYDNTYDVYVKYKNNELPYIYRFKKVENRLIVDNLSIGE